MKGQQVKFQFTPSLSSGEDLQILFLDMQPFSPYTQFAQLPDFIGKRGTI